MQENEIEIFYATSPGEWRKWLEENHRSKQSVWLVCYNKASGKKSITWSESVDVALCFGWIDSKKIRIDHEVSHQFFSRRKANSTWSKINKDKIKQLVEQGLMTPAGYETINVAKQNGSWTILDEVEQLIVPEDLKAAIEDKPAAIEFFENLSKSSKKAVLQWIALVKRPHTREIRIAEIVDCGVQNLKPKHLR